MAERVLTINGFKVRVKYSELPREVEEKLTSKVVSLAEEEEKVHKIVDDKKLATEIRDYLNKTPEIGGTEATAWHVIVGQHFVCSVKYESKTMIFFDLIEFHKSIIAFKSG